MFHKAGSGHGIKIGDKMTVILTQPSNQSSEPCMFGGNATISVTHEPYATSNSTTNVWNDPQNISSGASQNAISQSATNTYRTCLLAAAIPGKPGDENTGCFASNTQIEQWATQQIANRESMLNSAGCPRWRFRRANYMYIRRQPYQYFNAPFAPAECQYADGRPHSANG